MHQLLSYILYINNLILSKEVIHVRNLLGSTFDPILAFLIVLRPPLSALKFKYLSEYQYMFVINAPKGYL